MMRCTAAVVLAAGRGTRMQRRGSGGLSAEQTATAARGLKAMIPDARGRPFIDHLVSSLADAGVTDVCLVVRPDDGSIAEHYQRQPPHRVRITCLPQPAPRGTADAVLVTEAWTSGRNFLTLNADNLYPVDALQALLALDTPGLVAFDRDALVAGSNIDPPRIAAFAILDIGPRDQLRDIVEKPGLAMLRPAATAWISMNLWRFDQRIFAACREVELSERGEYELPLAVRHALQSGMVFRAVRVHAGVLDLSSQDDVTAIAQQLAGLEPSP